jgi:hypothetical protein
VHVTLIVVLNKKSVPSFSRAKFKPKFHSKTGALPQSALTSLCAATAADLARPPAF